MVSNITCPNCGHVLTTLPGLTARQQELFDFIQEFEKSGISPSYTEMAKGLRLRSKSGIHRLVLELEERGYITRRPYRERSIHTVKGLVT